MPRLSTPNGYYTATEAKKLLNVSDSVLRSYAQKGKIKYIIPPGRKQGFYLKEDVDTIINEIAAFLCMEENDITFTAARKEDLLEITKLADSFFSFELEEGEPEVPQWSYDATEKNPETEFILKSGDKIIGFVGTLPLRADIEKDTDKWHKLLTEERIAGVGLTKDDIEIFTPGKHVHLFITGIGIDKSIERSKRKVYGARLIGSFITKIVELGKRGIIIDRVTGGGYTKAGIQLLLTFGLHEIPALRPGVRIFTMDVQESGAPASMQYKEALAQWKQEHQ